MATKMGYYMFCFDYIYIYILVIKIIVCIARDYRPCNVGFTSAAPSILHFKSTKIENKN